MSGVGEGEGGNFPIGKIDGPEGFKRRTEGKSRRCEGGKI
jgi:hypothetical protein